MKAKAIFDALRHVCKGMNTTMDAVAVPIGVYSLLQNVRVDTGVLKVRNGATDLSLSGLDNGWIVGCAQVSLDGTDYVIVAVDTSADIRVYYSTEVAFTELTRSTGGGGSYNNTRFVSGVTPASYKRIEIVVVKAPTRADSGILSTTSDRDVLLVSDGVKSLAGTVSSGLNPQTRLARGTDFAKFRAEATFPDYMPISSGLSGVAVSDVDVTAATSSSITTFTGGVAPVVNFTTAADTDDYGELQWTTANDICQGPCVALMYSTTDAAFWDKFKLDFAVVTSHTLKTIWDPTSTTTTKDKPNIVTIDATKKVYMAVFPLDPANTPVATTFDRLRLTYKLPASPASQIDFFLLGWYAGGTIPGATRDPDTLEVVGAPEFWVSNYSSLGFTESEAVRCQNVNGVENTQLGMTDKLNKFEVPVFSECTYAYRVTYQASTEVGNGVDYALIYARFPDPSGYRPDTAYLIAQDQFAQYSAGSWTYLSGYSSGGLQAVTVNTATLLPRECPKPFHRPAMPFKSACWTDGRLILGGVKRDDSASYFQGLLVSKKGDPFDFSEFERFNADGSLDETGPVLVPLGGETPQRTVSIAGTRSDQEVSAPCVSVTDRGAWGIDTRSSSTLLRPVKVCDYGTKSPDSVVAGGGSVWWFDVYKQVRRASPRGIESPSLWRVESLWYGIPTSTTRTGTNPQTRPRVERVCCAYFMDKLYVAYTATGQTYNQACSVYDATRDLWYDDALGVNFERMFVWPVAGDKPQLRCFTVGDDTVSGGAVGSAPKLYSHETNTTNDDGTGITINVQTGVMHEADQDEGWGAKVFGQVGIVADKSTGESLSVVKTMYPGGTTVTGTINLSNEVSGSQLVRWEIDSDGNKPRVPKSVGCQVSIQGTYAPGKRIMAIYQRTDPRGPASDVSG